MVCFSFLVVFLLNVNFFLNYKKNLELKTRCVAKLELRTNINDIQGYRVIPKSQG